MFFSTIQSRLRTFIEWSLYVFIALFPFVIYQGYLFYGTATRSINLVVVIETLTIVFGIALLSAKRRVAIAKSPITITLFFFLLILFISGIQGVDFSTSFWSKATRMSGIFYFLHLGFFYFFLFMIFNEEKKLRRFLKIFLISTGIFSIGALLSKDGLGIMFTGQSWTGFTFGNSTFAAMYLYAAFMTSIYYVATQPVALRRWWKYLLPLVFIINPYFINREIWFGRVDILQHPLGIIGEAQASSFTAFFSIIFLLAIWLVSKIKRGSVRRSILWVSVVAGVLVMGFAVNSFLSQGGYLRELYLEQATNARPLVWGLSQKAIQDRPLLGWGTDNFDRAFEKHYDNHLLEVKNGAEAWFDRAHNIFIDQTVETGYLGTGLYLLIYAAVIGSMLYVLLRSKDRKDHVGAAVIIVYFVGHLMELQTAFDTTISYVSLAIMAALAAILFHKVYRVRMVDKSEWVLPKAVQYGVGMLLIAGYTALFFVGTVPIIRAESANGALRTVGSSEKRLQLYPKLFSAPLDRASFLWRTSSDLVRGIAQKPAVLEDSKKREGFVKELAVYTEEYREYIANHPNDFRMHISLASVYIYERLFEVNHLDDAHKVLDDAIVLVPQAPQSYWMKAVAYLYQRKFDLAREWARKGYELNPGVEQSKRIVDYIEESIKTFPEINLYSFVQV